MATETCQITINGLPVQIVRKAIKNLHLGVYPPEGRVRVATPLAVSNEAVRLAVIGKLPWIRRQQAKFEGQPRQSQREMLHGESHYFMGQRYRLRVVHGDGVPEVSIRNRMFIEIRTRKDADHHTRSQILQRWYRQELKKLIPPLVNRWSAQLGIPTPDCRVRRMKTRWGTCQIEAKRIWLNLELIKKSVRCLEYIIVHELVHFLERQYDERFVALMDRYLPQWQPDKRELNSAPLAHEDWEY